MMTVRSRVFFGFCVLSVLTLSAAGVADGTTVPVVHRVDGTQTPRIEVQPGVHTIIKTPADVRVSLDTAFGDPLAYSVTEFYVYRYSLHEAEHVRAGKSGREIFDGLYTLSYAFYRNTIVANRTVHAAASALMPSTYYYVWVEPSEGASVPFIVGFTDTDGDGWTDVAEDLNGNGLREMDETDPLNADTDGDTVSDGVERLFSMQSNEDASMPFLDPLRADADAAASLSAWMQTQTICVPNADAGDGDPFFDPDAVRIDAGCMPPVSVHCTDGVCDGE